MKPDSPLSRRPARDNQSSREQGRLSFEVLIGIAFILLAALYIDTGIDYFKPSQIDQEDHQDSRQEARSETASPTSTQPPTHNSFTNAPSTDPGYRQNQPPPSPRNHAPAPYPRHEQSDQTTKASSDRHRTTTPSSSARAASPAPTAISQSNPGDTTSRPRTRTEAAARSTPQNRNAAANRSTPHLIGTLEISGQVLDEAGWPVPGIGVTANLNRLFDDQAEFNPATQQFLRQAVTDSNGNFYLTQLPDGEYSISTITSDFYPLPASTVSRTGVTTVKLVVVEQRSVMLTGRVTSSNGNPVAGAEVVSLATPEQLTYTDQNGFYDLPLSIKRNSSSSIQFWADGFREMTLRISGSDTFGVSSLERDVMLEPDKAQTRVSGRLTGGGTPLSGEKVYMKSSGTNRKFQAVTDKSGRFEITDIEVGDDYILWVSPKDGYQTYRQNRVAVPANGLSNLMIDLEPAALGNLAGRMIDLEGNPIPNFTLFARTQNSTTSPVAVTGDAAGYFATDGISSGTLTLATSSLPKLSISGIQLRAGAQQNLDLILDIGRYQVRGRVRDPAGYPIPAANAILTWVYRDNGVTYESIHKTVSTAGGDFLIPRLGPAERTLTVGAPGFETIKMPYSIGFQTEQTIDVTLTPR